MYAPRNLGAQCDVKALVHNKDATAGGAGDATEVSCDEVDILGYSSAKLVIYGTCTLAADKTLSFETQKASRASTAVAADADAAVQAATVVKTGAAVAGTKFVHTIDIDLAGWKRHNVLKVTPDLSAENTDVANWGAVLLLFGKDSK